jgi:hypothetical protein
MMNDRQQQQRAEMPLTCLSRSYRTKESKVPSAHLEASTLMQELLIEAVRNAKCEPSPAWEKNFLRVHTELKEQGIDKIYKLELQSILRQRVKQDLDFFAEPSRFPNIKSTLMS